MEHQLREESYDNYRGLIGAMMNAKWRQGEVFTQLRSLVEAARFIITWQPPDSTFLHCTPVFNGGHV